jgi:hypothetical protein
MAKLVLRFGLDTMVPSAKDRLIAPRISTLSELSLPDIASEKKNLLGAFVFNFDLSLTVSNKHRQLLFNVIRKAEDARDEYERGAGSLRAYVQGRGLSLVPYFSALRSFEHCVAHLYQSVRCMNALSKTWNGPKQFDRNDGSVLARINLIHTEIKHMDARFCEGDCANEMSFAILSGDDAKDPACNNISNVPMWLTNEGLECSAAKLTFAELAHEIEEILIEAENLATLNPPNVRKAHNE